MPSTLRLVTLNAARASFPEAVLSLKLAREELLAGRLSLGAFYEQAGADLETAIDYLVAHEGLELAPILLRRNQYGQRHMFATPGMVKLYFTHGIGHRMAKVLNAASKNVYGHAHQGVTASTMLIWLPVADFCRALRLYYKAYRAAAPVQHVRRVPPVLCADSRWAPVPRARLARRALSRRTFVGQKRTLPLHIRGAAAAGQCGSGKGCCGQTCQGNGACHSDKH